MTQPADLERVATDSHSAIPAKTDVRADALRGIGMMLFGILLFVINDVMGKWLVATYEVGQVLLIRSIAALIVLAPIVHALVRKEGAAIFLSPMRPGLQAFRVLLSTFEVALFYWAVASMPLADVIAFYLAAPIFVTAMAGPLLGEKVGWRRWSAVAVGFVGVLIALRPSAASFTPASILALIGSFCFALMMITGRTLRGTSDIVLVTWQTVGALIFGILVAPFNWVQPTPLDLGLLGLLGIIAAIAHMCVNRSLKLAPAAVVVPYQYTQIAWAILFGWIIFGDLPETQMVVGAAIIIAAGFYIFMREQKVGRKA